ncbi:hypothetical protein HYQ46_012289 [Verticillium longisporum]|nr:hypothetical protein HYQ46_012289 [Verticillium longisporum]
MVGSAPPLNTYDESTQLTQPGRYTRTLNPLLRPGRPHGGRRHHGLRKDPFRALDCRRCHRWSAVRSRRLPHPGS